MLSVAGRTAKTVEFLAEDPLLTARLGQTPHEVVFRQGKIALRLFTPPAGVAAKRPIVVSMPLINTWTIWDLLPGRSLVAKLTAAGFPVFIVDWGRPGDEDAERPLSYYVDEVMGRCFRRARRVGRERFGTDELDALGYCVGGTFLSVFLSRHPQVATRAAFVAAPIDFHASGRLARWASPDAFPLDTLISSVGNYPAALMQGSFALLKPSNNTSKWWSLWDRIDTEGFPELWAALERWNSDNVDFPGEAYREYVGRCYMDNALVEGGWVMNGTPVDLGQATLPARVIAASHDHIAPPSACYGLAARWGGPCETETIQGGHVGISIGRTLAGRLIDWFGQG